MTNDKKFYNLTNPYSHSTLLIHIFRFFDLFLGRFLTTCVFVQSKINLSYLKTFECIHVVKKECFSYFIQPLSILLQHYNPPSQRNWKPLHYSKMFLPNLVPRVLSHPSLRSERERERDSGCVSSRVFRTKLILREESFVAQFCVPFTQ